MSSSSFFKSSGTSVTLQNTVDQLVTDAETAKTAAETAATNAASSAGLSSTYANNSNTSATNAAASLTSAQTAQSAAETAETNAETAQTAAETAETNAASSASTASTQASNASTSATAAASSASTASTKASEASTSATNAATSETNAATSATNAASSATTASGHSSTASTQASNASTSATNAATSETNAATSATTASTQASNASTSATNAASSASTASTQATNAANSATAAATSATNAASSATSAASSASTAQTLSNSFNNIYLGALSSAPTQHPDGSALDEGDLYYDTTQGELKVYKSSGWAAAGSTVNGTSARFHYDITTTTNTLSGADANGNTLAYDAGYVDVFVNGVRMSTADVTTTSGNSIVFTDNLVASDDVDIVAYGTFVITQLNADNLDSGTVPDARITGAYTGITNLTMSGDLTVDTSTLIANSSTNSVGIGTTASLATLNVLANSASRGLDVIGRSSDDRSRIQLLNNAGTDVLSQWDYSGTTVDFKAVSNIPLTFHTNATERMRIDSSGNLLVGVTSTTIPGVGNTTEGVSLRGSTSSASSIFASRATASAGYFNINADGDILSLRRSGTQIGCIGVTSSDQFYIARNTGNHGIKFKNSATMPSSSAGQDADNVQDLGSSSVRWKDLYLSGGVYLGGTGSANYLDDYEEGTFVPKFTFGGGSSGQSYSSVRNGFYTKIGDTVFITVRLELTARGSSTGTIRIADLPFTSISTSNSNSGFYIGYMANVSGNFDTNNIHLVIDPNETVITFRQMSSGSSVDMAESNFGNSSQVIVSGFYRTA